MFQAMLPAFALLMIALAILAAVRKMLAHRPKCPCPECRRDRWRSGL